MDDASRGYIAGFFDGEGSLYIRPHRSVPDCCETINVVIYQNDLDVLEWIQSLVGGRIFKAKAWNKTSSPQLSGSVGAQFLAEMIPLLRVKKEKAVEVLAAWNTRPAATRTQHGQYAGVAPCQPL